MNAAPTARTVAGDWHPGSIPHNVSLHQNCYIETTYSFTQYRSQLPEGVRLGEGSTVYRGTMFDVGPGGRVVVGRYALVNGAWIICDSLVEIGDHALLSWNVVLMDTYRAGLDPAERRAQLRQVPSTCQRRLAADSGTSPIRIGRNVWIGFDVCVLPGVTIGDGSIVGARSVVTQSVPPYTVVAGNPARTIRQINDDEDSPTH